MLEIRHDGMEKTADTQQAYNEIYTGKGIQLHDSFYLWLISLLKARPGSLLLDISCGQGRLVKFAQEQGLRAIGADFAHQGVFIGKEQSPKAAWVTADGEKMPMRDHCVDYITHIGSLEHYQDPEAGMREISRLLKKTGTACILVPNSFALVGNIQRVVNTGDIFDDGQPLQRYNTRLGWHNLLRKNGLNPFRTLKYERAWPRTWADFRWYTTHPSKVLRLFASWFIPVNLGNSLVYLCNNSVK